MAGEEKPPRAVVGARAALVRAGGALLLLGFGAFPAQAALESAIRGSDGRPAAFGLSVIPGGKREVTVSWTLRTRDEGARVVLYAGTSFAAGFPLAEVAALPGLHSYRFVDRSVHDGQWLYWLVVDDGRAGRSVLGTLVCVSPAMDCGPAPASPDARPLLAEWPEAERVRVRWDSPGEPVAAGTPFPAPPLVPPPEASSASGGPQRVAVDLRAASRS